MKVTNDPIAEKIHPKVGTLYYILRIGRYNVDIYGKDAIFDPL